MLENAKNLGKETYICTLTQKFCGIRSQFCGSTHPRVRAQSQHLPTAAAGELGNALVHSQTSQLPVPATGEKVKTNRMKNHF